MATGPKEWSCEDFDQIFMSEIFLKIHMITHLREQLPKNLQRLKIRIKSTEIEGYSIEISV